jgi:hypothetical protein
VDLQEPLERHGDGLESGGGLLGDLGTLAVLAVTTPGQHVFVHRLPDDTCRHETTYGTYAWVRQVMEGGEDGLAMGEGDKRPGLRQADVRKGP